MNLEAVLKTFNLNLSSATGGLVYFIATCLLVKTIQDIIKWVTIGRKKPPGPTGLPIVGYLPFLGKEPYKEFLKLRETYGNVIGRLHDPHKIEVLVNFTNTVLAFTGASFIASAVPGLRNFCEVFKIGGHDKAAQYNRDFASFLKEEINLHKTSSELKDVQDFINSYLNKMAELSNSKNTNHFFSGRRNCPGEAIAWMEMLLYFSETVKKFEISTPPGVEPEFEIVPGLVQHLAPQSLCFKERNN
ncbi:hypothetical protein AVEN_197566-1 [Araneus ventricosus]|uniref:Uncharacterized protein n=1 Tax=Araneus ventricosus TaxID=182803 RepID=A0A4Y2U3G2_ARAVE|nr:hypothetical protein AVEN_197566-1 [Araneus ventricosus]